MLKSDTATDADRAYEKLKNMIVTLEMSPGSVVRESLLREQLGLGRTPIREALKRLEAENLVIIKPRRGIFIADIAITDLTQIYEVRLELEALCARLAAQRASKAYVDRLQLLLDDYEQIDESDLSALFTIDREFHVTLAQASMNTFLMRELQVFYNLSLRIWYLAINNIQSQTIDVAAHAEIVAAVAARDAVRAEERMRVHIRNFHEGIRRLI
jgi:DNA-binding GntR family transcriptional regulator